MTRIAGVASFLSLSLFLIVADPSLAEADQGESHATIWFYPSPQSADYLDLFRNSAAWSRIRNKISIFGLAPEQIDSGDRPVPNSLAQLVAADAFRKLQSWRIALSVTSPSVKEWDCSGNQGAATTIRNLEHLHAAHATVKFIDMDEPLNSGLGRNKPVCNLSIAEVARRTADYVKKTSASIESNDLGPVPGFVDSEGYPAISEAELENWIDALQSNGFSPAAFHLDVNFDILKFDPDARRNFPSDLRKLARYLKEHKIAFGVIFWSGHDPERSDRDYFNDTLTWVKAVHDAIGRPDILVFASWVTRCSEQGDCRAKNFGCSSTDPDSCGKMSVPLNLPESGLSKFSHTYLIMQALKILQS